MTWSAAIGDPTPMGWITTIGYVITAWLCLRACRVEARQADRAGAARGGWLRPGTPAQRAAALWLLLAVAFLFLALNKQLDLQSLLTYAGRTLARTQGWYEKRRSVQALFVVVLFFAGLVALAVLAWLARGRLRDFALPLLGAALTLAFVMARAASFHKADTLLGLSSSGPQISHFFELLGMAMAGFGALRWVRRPRRRRR